MEISNSLCYKTGTNFCCYSGGDFLAFWRVVE